MSYVIVFGVRSSKIEQRNLEGETKCPKCSARNSYLVSGKASYFHFFWIITFPLSKRLVFVCKNCEDVVRPKHNLPASVQRTLKTTDKVKRPVWHYTGFMLIAFFIGSIILQQISDAFSHYRYEERNEQEEERREKDKDQIKIDLASVRIHPSFNVDSISNLIVKNINLTEIGFDLEQTGFLSKLKDDKLLVLINMNTKPKNYTKLMGKTALIKVEEYLYERYAETIDEIYVGLAFENSVIDQQPHKHLYMVERDRYLLEGFYDTGKSYGIGASERKEKRDKRARELVAKKEMKKIRVDSAALAKKIKEVAKKYKFPLPKEVVQINDQTRYDFLSEVGYEIPKELEVLEAVLNGEGPFRTLRFMFSEVEKTNNSYRRDNIEELTDERLNDKEKKILPYRKNPYWIEFYDDYLIQYSLDLMPDENGTVGQIFVIDEADNRRWVANNMIEFFDLYLKGEIPFDLEDWVEESDK